ncbi:MAG TPA: (Fe-S)-binding protein, partial [Gaiellaceae bacterium]|nr:(Fe-S)-binding protein [Gaiellaceae bacterium]
YTQDGGDFAHAALRCVGVGRCRIPGGDDVMCPSYIVTKEEMHTTRGRARLLFEMLEGDVVTDGWRSGEVKEALDLCLACKGCTSDCPVDVDMPTYKAEFLHHHYAGRLRPRHAYAFGLVDQAARLAARMPGLANIVTHAPVLARAAKLVSGMSREREIPAFAPLTLQDWFAERGERNAGAPRVLLWPDTFTNHFHTEVGVAAAEALEAAGCQVVIPQAQVCCGRPLYDYGFLSLAERYLRRSLAQLGEELRRGTPIVGIEPSCVAVFKDELPKLLPHDDDARRLSGTVRHLGEFLRERGLEPPHLAGKALLWGHCHHKATGGLDPDRALLESMGLEVEEVSGGCCGLAGSWGFEADHYELSMKAGEHALLPSVREAGSGTLVVANGFSCRTQVEHGARRRALHLAEVLKLARDGELAQQPAPSTARRARRAAGLGAAVAVAAAAGALALRSVR